mgnify:CR=1 FL=1
MRVTDIERVGRDITCFYSHWEFYKGASSAYTWNSPHGKEKNVS